MADDHDPVEPGSRDALAAWLTEATGQPVSPGSMIVSAPSSGGWSNDTWMVDIGDGTGRRAVVRLVPERASMFPAYDLERQVRCLEALAGVAGVPTPALLGVDLDGARLGRAAFVMEHVEGRVPSDDRPTFAESGWLRDAAPSGQRRFHEGVIDCLANLHALDVDTLGLGDLAATGPADSNRAELDLVRELWEWDRGDRWPARIDDALASLDASVPAPSAEVLLWGDARPANVVVAAGGFEPVALLDWELASVGSPERELTWLLEMNWVRIQGAGLEPLPGFLSDDETVAHYERASGRALRHLSWYRAMAAVRVAVFMHRYLRAMVHADRLPADHALLTDTVASRRLDRLPTR